MFTLKVPESNRLALKGARGFLGEAYFRRPGLFDVSAVLATDSVSLKAGEETEVSVPVADLPANADVKSIKARLEVTDSAQAATSQSRGFSIKLGEEQPTPITVTSDALVRPRNVTVRLDRGESIWTFSDTLVNDHYELPDFAEQLNAYLDKVSSSESQVTLRFLVKSDTPGNVRIVISAKSVKRVQTQTWRNEGDQTIRVDRNLQLDFGDRLEIPLDPVAATDGSALTGIRLDVSGTFGVERLLGRIRQHPGDDYATVNSDYAIAQRLCLDTTVQIAGISGLLVADGEAELYLELQSDRNGIPGADTPVARANVTVAPDAGVASWVYSPFPAPVELKPDVTYWIVVKAVRGTVRIGVEADADNYLRASCSVSCRSHQHDANLMVNRNGMLWKTFRSAATPIFSMLRLVYVPGIDNQSAAIRIAIRNTDTQYVDPQQAPTTIAFALENASLMRAVIEITSHARGTLTLANVIQEY